MLSSMPLGPDGAMLLVESNLLRRLEEFRQVKATTPEFGGILMGYRRGVHTHITEATFPVQEDVRRRFGFVRRAEYHTRMAVRRWNETDETLDYVGEWHTHPEDHPSPSSIDLVHWRKIVRTSPRQMVFLIVGRVSYWLGTVSENDVAHVCFSI